jgi:hypothetical protein
MNDASAVSMFERVGNRGSDVHGLQEWEVSRF